MLIQTRNLLEATVPKTFLLATEAAGTTVFRLRNTTGFGSSWAVQLGETGDEQTEVLVLNGQPPNSGTLGTTTAVSAFEHPADTPVYAIKFNQVVFERSTAGTAGTATPLTNGTVTYQADSNDGRGNSYTVFDDTGAQMSYAYRTYFRNSVTGITSFESDWILPAGFGFYTLAAIRQRVKDKLWDSTYIDDDLMIDNWINEYKDKMSNAVIAINEDFALGTTDVGFSSDGYGTVTTADFKSVRRMDITYNGSDFYLAARMSPNDYYPDEQFSSVHPYYAWLGDNKFIVKPEESGGSARITFYRFGTTLVNDTDELPQPFRPYTDGFVDYGLSQALFKDGKLQEYDRKLVEANASKGMFVSEMTPRDKQPRYVDLTEPIDAG